MKPLTVNDFAENAYRILGLTADATQADIDRAARRMRIWKDKNDIPPTANDAAFLGTIRRQRSSIEGAVARLADPEQRVEERIWWFCLTPPSTDSAPARGLRSVLGRHDQALLDLHRALHMQADIGWAQWRQLIERFATLADDGEYRDWLLAMERTGEFEKRARTEEVVDAQRCMRNRIGWTLADRLEKELEAYDRSVRDGLTWGSGAAAAQQIGHGVGMLQTEEAKWTDGAWPQDPLSLHVLDRIEDLLLACYADREGSILETWKAMTVETLKPACDRAVYLFNNRLEPLLNEILSLARKDAERMVRIRQRAAAFLSAIVDAYDACESCVDSERTLRTALVYGTGTALEPRLQERLAKVLEKLAEKEQADEEQATYEQKWEKPIYSQHEVVKSETNISLLTSDIKTTRSTRSRKYKSEPNEEKHWADSTWRVVLVWGGLFTFIAISAILTFFYPPPQTKVEGLRPAPIAPAPLKPADGNDFLLKEFLRDWEPIPSSQPASRPVELKGESFPLVPRPIWSPE
jgi:hypothetical protein